MNAKLRLIMLSLLGLGILLAATIVDAKRRKRCTICQLTEPHLWWRSVTLGCCLPTLTPAHKAHQNHSAAKQRQGGWKWDDGRRAIEEYRARNIVGLWAGDRFRVKWVHQGIGEIGVCESDGMPDLVGGNLENVKSRPASSDLP